MAMRPERRAVRYMVFASTHSMELGSVGCMSVWIQTVARVVMVRTVYSWPGLIEDDAKQVGCRPVRRHFKWLVRRNPSNVAGLQQIRLSKGY